MARRITIVSAGHMTHCPRMLKAADALSDAGYDVRVVSGSHTEWGARMDRELARTRRWRWQPVEVTRHDAPLRWLASGARTKVASAVAEWTGTRTPWRVMTRAFGRLHDELKRAVLEDPGDFVYGGSTGALAAVLEAASASGVPCGLDFEDFHCAEHEADVPGGLQRNRLAHAIMAAACREATLVTAGSEAIADAVAETFGRRPVAIDNVFPLPPQRPARTADGPLQLYWFSQTIGRHRGIEVLVDAARIAGVECVVHLRGVPVADFVEQLQARAAGATHLRIVVHEPAAPDRMVASCAGYHAGLSGEQGHIRNRDLNLSNKALTYPLAGLALILTDTQGHRPLIESVAPDAIVYQPGNVEILADGLRRWALDGRALRRAGDAAWEAACSRWHWEHPLERDRLLTAVAQVVH